MSDRPSSSNAGGRQNGARISVKDRLGPLQSSFKRRDRNVDRNRRRGRKFSESVEGPESNLLDGSKPSEGRIPVRDRLGPLPAQSFKKKDQFLQKNRPQGWRHQGKHETSQQVLAENKDLELEQEQEPAMKPKPFSWTLKPENVENIEYVKPPVPAVFPSLKPFNPEQHKKAWTWVRPTGSSSMDIDQNMDQST